MSKLKKYKHDNKDGYDHTVICPKCSNSSLMDNGQYVGVETSICPHCGHRFRNTKSKL
ncbi:MAG: hypothetical protein ACRD32_01810 [Nitrososphaerales archaeon]